ncbi:hypothetical protein [Rhodoferax sp.]|uniref:hypothetical protein n=1 Tax=Rhodoferax sp. TaxID=50421 RepID=UPI00260D7EDB|nr:hypothetical protein [Rhodoferax sp.]MDD5000509.1 hypothetical protein [Thiomonas arsenitoxydans]MDD5478495.1 hypothetical protein [Rhodoferax sp.]
MKTIFENSDYKAATEQLTQLCEGHAAAVFEESALLARLNDQPNSKPSALDRAKAMLTGGTPAPRQDRTGLQQRLDACRESLALLNDAINEQRQAMSGLVQAQSATVNAAQREPHIKAAQRIRTALAGLREAMATEQGIRAEIAAGGYQCSLEPLERPELNFADSQATISHYLRDVNAYVTLNEIGAAKSVNVRLLFGTGDDMPGDVLTLTGHEAAALVRIGHAEQTRDKPGRVKRPVVTSYGQTMATALS